MRGMSIEDRKAIVELFPLMNVVPIPYAGDQHLMSCDNRRLHIFRSVLPSGTTITVVMAPDAEIKKLKWKWTTRDGLNAKIRTGEKKCKCSTAFTVCHCQIGALTLSQPVTVATCEVRRTRISARLMCSIRQI